MSVRDDEFEDEDDDATLDASHFDDATDPCPHCGEAIYDDAERCPACGSYLSREDAPLRRRPWWIVAGVVLCILIVLTWIFSVGF